MKKTTFTYFSNYPCSAKELYLWHSRKGSLQRLLPPWQKIEILQENDGLEEGAFVKLRLYGLLPFWSVPFVARHGKAEPFSFFQDKQERGIFSYWQHKHHFKDTKTGCELRDEITYSLPLHNLLPSFIHKYAEKKLRAMFDYRAARLLADIRLHHHLQLEGKSLRLLVSGVSGSVGSELLPLLTTAGHTVWRLVRHLPQKEHEIFWNPTTGEIDLSSLPPLDGVIHLGGESIGMSRWSEAKKKRVFDSRVQSTRVLVNAISTLPILPKVFLCASASGYYGEFCGYNNQGELPLENSAAGNNFIAAVCKAWESEASKANTHGIRTVNLRFAVGLAPQWGALQQMLKTSFAGVIRSLGDGSQQMGWIAIEDMATAILHCLVTPEIEGPVNIATPNPVSNRDFHRILAKVIKKPLLCSLPKPLIKLIYGQIADEMLLADCAINPQKLIDSGFSFRHPELEDALLSMLGLHTNKKNKELQETGVQE